MELVELLEPARRPGRKRESTLIFFAGKAFRKGCGIYYAAHPADPTIERCYRRRLRRQERRKVSPSTSRWERRHGLRPIRKRDY